ncbi:MAG: 50S ribosomal protein L23 [Parcubacteria group bacterium GW2011_GWE2_37_8]|nr:MAG: 50S ribosomal protein L23 [Parcubacteria group bacterium GW2011_GWE2_37_8]
MSLFDFLKNKKRAEKKKEVVKSKSESPKGEFNKKTEKEVRGISFNGESAGGVRVLKQPLITEKSTHLAENNKYVFKVFDNANKTEIKRVVEKLYGVKVEAVNLLNMPGKKRRVGKTMGRQSGFKKAIISLPKGQKIDILAQ